MDENVSNTSRIGANLSASGPDLFLFCDGGVTALDVHPEVSMPFGSQNWKYQETKPHLTFEQDQTETKRRSFEKSSPRETESTRFDILKQIPLLVLKKFLRLILTDKVGMNMLI